MKALSKKHLKPNLKASPFNLSRPKIPKSIYRKKKLLRLKFFRDSISLLYFLTKFGGLCSEVTKLKVFKVEEY